MNQSLLRTMGLWLSVAALGLVFQPAGAEDFLVRLDGAVLTGDTEALSGLFGELGEAPAAQAPDDVYLWSYTGWRLSQRLGGEKKRRKQLLKSVQAELEALVERQPGDAEALALLGSVLGDRIDGMMSGIRLGGRASELLERAYDLAPRNPRVALQRGVGFANAPKAFGGGKEKAEQELRRAVELFAVQPAAQPWPHWGYRDAMARLGQVLVELGRTEEARQLYQQALQREPGFAWIRDELLPALNGAGS